MELAERAVTNGGGTGEQGVTGEPSVSSSIEHLVSGSQGVITKRIDLALLEGRELLSRTLQGVALVGVAIVLAAGAWFAVTACVVLLATPDAGWVVRLAAFGSLSGGSAAGLLLLAMRRARPQRAVRPSGNGSSSST